MNEFITDVDKLSEPSVEVDLNTDRNKIKSIITQIKYLMQKNNLVALSAPQIGEKVRVFCINFTSDRKGKKSESVYTFINPIITGIRGVTFSREQCINLQNKQFINVRNTELSMAYQGIDNKSFSQKFIGKTVSVIQQMVDFLDGILPSDMGLEIDDRFDSATDFEREELLKAYVDSLDVYKEKVNNDIDSNPNLTEMKNAISFIQSVRSGETDLGDTITVHKTDDK